MALFQNGESIVNNNRIVMDKNELNRVLERTIGWINNCDTKISVILSGLVILFGVFLATDHLKKSVTIIKCMLDNFSIFAIIYLTFALISILLVLIGVGLLIMALLPRTNILKYKEKKVNSVSLLFFSTISNYSSINEYKKEIEKCNEKQFIDDLINQIYVCSLICHKKFEYYKKGLFFSIIGIVLYCLMDFIGILIV